MMRPIKRVEVSMAELDDILERAQRGPLADEDCAKLRKAMETLVYLTDLVGDKDTTIGRLRRILFGESTEKIRNILGKEGGQAGSPAKEKERDSSEMQPSDAAGESSQDKAKGHGRNGAESFTGAKRVHVAHGSLKPGQRCPTGDGTMLAEFPVGPACGIGLL